MARVIRGAHSAVAGVALSLFFNACAPSVPRSPEKLAPFDAGADHASTIPETDSGSGSTTARDSAVKDNASSDAPARDAPAPDAPAPDAPTRDAPAPDAAAAGGRDGATDGRDGGASADRGSDDDADVGAPPGGDATGARAPRPGDLKIDELLINPAGTDSSREWIEVANLSDAALDLRLLHVADAAGDVAVDAGVLAPGALLVLGQSLDPARNGGAPIAFSFGNTISLNNPGDTILLCLGACADGVVLDQVVWSADLGAAFDGHAAIIGATGDGGNAPFCPAAEPFGTAGSFGSPGQPNPPCP
jgi:hypothetical protein